MPIYFDIAEGGTHEAITKQFAAAAITRGQLVISFAVAIDHAAISRKKLAEGKRRDNAYGISYAANINITLVPWSALPKADLVRLNGVQSRPRRSQHGRLDEAKETIAF